MTKALAAAFVVACGLAVASAQAPAPPPVDTSKVGPQVGRAVPPLEGVDQFGRKHTLASVAGPKGTMLVFFRSADW
jgi:hypothetical protein